MSIRVLRREMLIMYGGIIAKYGFDDGLCSAEHLNYSAKYYVMNIWVV